jgi:hypothetical protein
MDMIKFEALPQVSFYLALFARAHRLHRENLEIGLKTKPT